MGCTAASGFLAACDRTSRSFSRCLEFCPSTRPKNLDHQLSIAKFDWGLPRWRHTCTWLANNCLRRPTRVPYRFLSQWLGVPSWSFRLSIRFLIASWLTSQNNKIIKVSIVAAARRKLWVATCLSKAMIVGRVASCALTTTLHKWLHPATLGYSLMCLNHLVNWGVATISFVKIALLFLVSPLRRQLTHCDGIASLKAGL